MLNFKAHRIHQNTLVLLTLLISLAFRPLEAGALGKAEGLPEFQDFAKSVQNQESGVLRGVYIPEVLALPVVQQPAGNAGYVSLSDGEITEFGMAAQVGNIGLLAHNNLSGRLFSNLAVGQEVRLVYGDGKIEYFVITELLKFQALEPTNPYSKFRDLSNEKKLTAEQLFGRVYRGKRHVTFQTCIEANGELSWGRLFVIATPRLQLPQPDYHGWHSPR